MGETEGRRRAELWIWGLALVPYGFFVLRFDRLVDDAYIYFRYARNLARGHGFSFNPGVDPPVEGFAGPLWPAILGLVHALGGDVLVWSRVLTVACGAALLWLLARALLHGLGASRLATAVGVLWVAVVPVTTAWSTGGLPTLVYLLLVFLCYERLLAWPGRAHGLAAGMAGVGATLVRFDGLGFAVVALAAGGLASWLREDRQLRSATVRACAVVALGVAALELWRWSSFGQLLPNVAYAKLGLGPAVLVRGGHYVGRFLTVFPIVLVIAAAALLQARRIASPATGGAAALVAASFAHTLLVGGDFMTMFRFLAPAVLFLGVLLAASVDALRRGGARGDRLAGALAGLALLGALMPALGLEPLRLGARRVLAAGRGDPTPPSQAELLILGRPGPRNWIELGRLLKANVPPGSTLVQGAVGAVGWYSDLPLLDQYGLTQRELARAPIEEVRSHAVHIGGHDKYGDLEFFEHRKPDYGFANVYPRAELERPSARILRQVFGDVDERFLALYRPVVIPVPDHPAGERFLLLAERDPDPDGGDNGWREALLRPENLRPPRGRPARDG